MIIRGRCWHVRQIVLTLAAGILILTLLNGNRFAFDAGGNSGRPPVAAEVAQAKEEQFDSYPIVGESWSLIKRLPNGTTAQFSGKPKLILSLSSEFSQANLGGCPDWNCKMVTDRSNPFEDVDAVIMQSARSDFDDRRKQSQYFVYFSQESPHHSNPSQPYAGYYNMTMSFRRDSDLPCPYGYTVRLNVPLTTPFGFSPAALATKKKPIAWFVSNCAGPSNRMAYVNVLKTLIPVHIFGACGDKSCPKGEQCENRLRSQYRFYLALENSICKDYVTEKFWSQGFLDVVPIVLKRSIYANYAPPHSFIALDDFRSPKQLVVYLKYLMENNTAYNEYFRWKRTHRVVFLNGRNHDRLERPWGVCRLCWMLWQTPRPRRVIPDMHKWWVTDAQCDMTMVKHLLLNMWKEGPTGRQDGRPQMPRVE